MLQYVMSVGDFAPLQSGSGVHQACYSVGAGPLSLWLVHVTAHVT